MKPHLALLCLVFSPLLCPPVASGQVGNAGTASPYLGVWETEDGPLVVRFLPDKAAVLFRGALFGEDVVNVYQVRYGAESAELIREGEALTARPGDGDQVVLELGGASLPLRRAADLPEALVIQAYPIAVATIVTNEELAAIRAELAAREDLDQAVRVGGTPGDSAGAEAMVRVDVENTAYLRGLIQRVGWISRERFGPEAAGAAFVIVQHSGDVRLMLTALPQIERELPTGTGSAQDFALVYDRTMGHLAEAQRYGTQASQDVDGVWAVRCLESEVMVDDYRARLGLPSLGAYLLILAEAYGIDEVGVDPDCPW